MKKLLFLVILLIHGFSVQAQYTLIPNQQFEQELIDLGIDSEGILDGQVLTSDVASVTQLDVSDLFIFDLTGIQDFTSLEILNCSGNHFLNSLDVTNLLFLKELYCGGNTISNLDISNNVNLESLDCSYNRLWSIDVSNNVLLEELGIGDFACDLPGNGITSVDLSNNSELVTFSCSFEGLIELDLFNNLKLENLYITDNHINEIDLSNNIQLTNLFIHNNNLTDLDLSNNTLLQQVVCGEMGNPFCGYETNKISSLDFSNLPNLWKLRCSDLDLITLNIQNGNNLNLTQFVTLENDNLSCLQVDDPEAVIAGVIPPYDSWNISGNPLITDDCTVGVNDAILNSVISFYPNPVDDFLYIDTSLPIKSIKLYSILGELILEKNTDFESINCSKLKPNTYILEIESEKGVISKKVMKI